MRQGRPIRDEYQKKSQSVSDEHAKTVEEIKRLEREGKRNAELENRLRGLGLRIYRLSVEEKEAYRPIEEALETLERDSGMNRLQKQADDNFRLILPRFDKMRELRRILVGAEVSVRRWRQLWYLLEVAFPSVIGLVAIIVPYFAV